MNRRDSIKTMLLGALGSSMIINGCAPDGSNRRRLQDVYDLVHMVELPRRKPEIKRYSMIISLRIMSLRQWQYYVILFFPLTHLQDLQVMLYLNS